MLVGVSSLPPSLIPALRKIAILGQKTKISIIFLHTTVSTILTKFETPQHSTDIWQHYDVIMKAELGSIQGKLQAIHNLKPH